MNWHTNRTLESARIDAACFFLDMAVHGLEWNEEDLPGGDLDSFAVVMQEDFGGEKPTQQQLADWIRTNCEREFLDWSIQLHDAWKRSTNMAEKAERREVLERHEEIRLLMEV